MGTLGFCKTCGGENCLRGTEVICISCGLPANPRDVVKEEDPARAKAILLARAKARAQRLAAEKAVAERTAEKTKPKVEPAPAPEAAPVAVAEPEVVLAESVAEPATEAEPAKPKRKR